MLFLTRSLNGEQSLLKFQLSDLDPDLHQNLIRLSLSHTQPAHQISSRSIYNFLRYLVHSQTERGENITSFPSGGKGKYILYFPKISIVTISGPCCSEHPHLCTRVTSATEGGWRLYFHPCLFV